MSRDFLSPVNLLRPSRPGNAGNQVPGCHAPIRGGMLPLRAPRTAHAPQIGFPHLIFRPTIAVRRLCMFGMLAVLVYLLAMGIPIYLLYRFHSQSWYWHTLSVLAAITLGFIPIPFELQKPEFDLLFGFTFIVLMIR